MQNELHEWNQFYSKRKQKLHIRNQFLLGMQTEFKLLESECTQQQVVGNKLGIAKTELLITNRTY